MGGVELELLGTPKVTVDGAPLEVDTRKAVALLAYLAVTGEERRRDSLAGLLWPDYEQTHARAALRRTLSALNKALGGRAMVVNRGALGIEPGELTLDVHRFRVLLRGCKVHSGNPSERCPACLEALSRAAALYRDDFMTGFTLRDCPEFDEWVFFEAESLKRDMLQALQRLVRGAAAAGDLDTAVRHAMRWLRFDPLHEPAHQELMRLYALSGRRSTALSHYRDCVALLERELGVPPLEETTRLYQAIRDGSIGPSPDRGSQPSPAAPVPRPVTTLRTLPPGLPFVGRDDEARALRAAFDGIRSAGCLVGVEGEAGIGKTRLVEEFLAGVAAEGAPVLTVRCHADEGGLAFGVVAEALREALASDHAPRLGNAPAMWLAEAARILPELESAVGELPGAPPLEVPGARARFLEGLAHVLVTPLTGPPNGVLFVDDLQWIDESSLEVLGYVTARLRRWPLCVVASWRSEDPSSVERARRLLGAADGAGRLVHLRLGRLDREAVTQLVETSAGSETEVAGRLFEETEGLPVLIDEYLKARAERPDGGWELPRGAREVLLARLGNVSETASQLLSAASVLGRSFTFETLRAVSGRSEEESLTAVEELVARGLLVESGVTSRAEESYDFSHDKLRAVVYEGATLIRRRLLHRRAAESLQRQRGAGASAAVVARHLLEAGDDGAAAQQFKLAGDHARGLFANAEALAHYETALGLGHPDVGALHVAVGDLHTLRGDYRGALAAYEGAAARPTGTDMATIEHRIAMVHHRRGDWATADGYLASALSSVTSDDGDALRARLTSDRSLTAHRAGRHEEAQLLAEEALGLAGRAGDRRSLAQAHNILGVLANGRRDFDSAVEHLEVSLELADALGEPGGRVAALNNLSLTRRARGELQAALSLAERALESCAAQGDRHREAALHNNVADLLHAVGDKEGSMTHLKAAVAIFAEIGEVQHPQPEIWKLFEW